MSAADDLLKAVQAFKLESKGNARLASVVSQFDLAVDGLRGSAKSPGARASAQAMTPGKYLNHKQLTFNGAGQEPQLPSEEPGEVQSPGKRAANDTPVASGFAER